jgi:transposase
MSRSLLFAWRRQVREGAMPGVVRAEAAAGLVPVRVVQDASPPEGPRPSPPLRGPAGRPGRSGTTVEVVLRNGRVLRVAEAIGPEVLGRLASALDG